MKKKRKNREKREKERKKKKRKERRKDKKNFGHNALTASLNSPYLDFFQKSRVHSYPLNF